MSTSDRELLDLAAKSSQQEIHWTPDGKCYRIENGLRFSWNPLTDDGDALRLAFTIARSHQVDFNIHIFGAGVKTGSQMAKNRGSFINEVDLASVRRSIVETAAQIGKDMT